MLPAATPANTARALRPIVRGWRVSPITLLLRIQDFARCSPLRGCSEPERHGCIEPLTRFKEGLQCGKDHRPASVELIVRAFTQLIVRDPQAAGCADWL